MAAACGGPAPRSSPTTTAAPPSLSQEPAPGYDPNASPAPASDVTSPLPPGTTPQNLKVSGPPSPPSASPVLAAVVHAFSTMTWTVYAHHDVVDRDAGTYQFDCVGMTNYFLSLGAPADNAALRRALGIGAHYVPRPAAMAGYFAALPDGGNGAWTPVRHMAEITGGDIIAVPPKPGTSESGHALIAGGPPRRLPDGAYALLVWDSTATAHGPGDTRLTDPRNRPLPPTAAHPQPRPSGLGRGTIMLAATATGAPGQLYWSIDGPAYGTQVEIARPDR